MKDVARTKAREDLLLVETKAFTLKFQFLSIRFTS